MSSSERSWTVDSTVRQLRPQDVEEPAGSKLGAYPLMAFVEGQFPDAFAGKERPAWPKAPQQGPLGQFGQPPPPPDDELEAPAAPVAAAPGKLVLLGCSQMFRKNFLQAGNLDLFLNSVDAVSLNENLVRVRGRKPINRAIEPPKSGTKTLWRFMNYGLANLLIAGAGIGLAYRRRSARNAYTLAQMAATK